MELPKIPRDIVSINPHMFLIYSQPKIGKTTIVSQLPDSLLIELEPEGANYVKANVIDVAKPSEFDGILDQIIAEGKPYKYVIVDTITKLDEFSEIVGTYQYMKKPMGQKFNKLSNGQIINHTDPRFETVHTLPNGAGYQFSRQVMIDWYDKLSLVAENVILLAHIKDKFIESKIGDTVESIDINLTGKVSRIYSSRVDAIAWFYRKKNVGILKFDNEYKALCGGRCAHLDGEIIISEKQDDGEIKTYWDRIYLNK